MSARPLLTPINPSSTMAARSPSPSSSSSGSGSGDDSAPATPSKDKMREWTFPRAGGGAAPSTGGARESQNEVDGIHGRSSSVAPSSAGGHTSNGRIQSPSSAKGGGGDGASLDLRHRSNASLAFAPSSLSPPSTTLSLPRLLSSSPSSNSPNQNPNLAKLVYSNIRRRSAHDLFFILVFGGAFLLFARALAGAGYDAPSSSELARAGEGAEVQLPPGFLPAEEVERKEEGEYLEEVHQRQGDSSHDVGEDWVRDSPDSLDEGEHLEEHAHDAEDLYAYHPPSADPSFDDSPSPASDEDDELLVDAPSSSNPELEAEAEDAQEEDGPRIVRLSSTSSTDEDADESLEEDPLVPLDVDADEEDSLVITREEAEREDPEALDEDAEIEPTLNPSPPSSPSTSLLDSPSEEPEELTALEELLDSASFEASTDQPSLLDLPLEEEEKRVLERAGRGREALRAGGGGKGKGRGKGGRGRRMERRVRR